MIIMKNALVVLLSIISVFIFSSCRHEPLCVMTYNIHHGAPLAGERDAARNAEIINRYSPDIVALQELDSMTTRCPDNFLADIGALTDMHPYFCSAMDFAGGGYGIGMLCREVPITVSRHALPGSEEPRALLVVEFDKYIAACTHLSLTAEDRLASISIISDILAQTSKPFMLLGDFNDEPETEFIKLLCEHFEILNEVGDYTFPADVPDRTIDYILLDKRHAAKAEVMHSEVADEPEVSDHRPVIVKLRLD